jgi:OH-DDVA oxygenase
MAEIVLGLGTSHAPQLSTPPESWPRRGNWDKGLPKLVYQGQAYTYPELLEARGAAFERELTADKAQVRYDTCQQAIGQLATTLEEAAPDVLVMLGDDQNEVFVVEESTIPAFTVFTGPTVDNAPYHDPNRVQMGIDDATWSHMPPERVSYPAVPTLAEHIVRTLVAAEFDPAHSRKLPPGRHGNSSVGHAFGFVYRRVLNDRLLPSVPIFINTYYPPNQPTARRCYEFGRTVRRGIDSWEGNQRVAVVTSGGLTHFVIDEEFDQQILRAMQARNHDALTSIAESYLMSGNSEIKNWITLAGVMADSDLPMHLLDYVPCYRTEAGTGCGMAFARWN